MEYFLKSKISLNEIFHSANNISRSQWLRSLRFQNRYNPPLELIINYPLGLQCQLRAQNDTFISGLWVTVRICIWPNLPEILSFAKCRRIWDIWYRCKVFLCIFKKVFLCTNYNFSMTNHLSAWHTYNYFDSANCICEIFHDVYGT